MVIVSRNDAVPDTIIILEALTGNTVPILAMLSLCFIMILSAVHSFFATGFSSKT